MTVSKTHIRILNMLLEGETYPDIAKSLGISERTVYLIADNMKKSMGVKKTTQLVVAAIEAKIIESPRKHTYFKFKYS